MYLHATVREIFHPSQELKDKYSAVFQQFQLPLLFVIKQNTAGQFPSWWKNVCVLIDIGFGFIQRKFEQGQGTQSVHGSSTVL